MTIRKPRNHTHPYTGRPSRGHRVMRRMIDILIVAVATLVVLTTATSTAVAQDVVTVSVDGTELEAESTQSVPILIDGASGIVATHVEITYDPAVLQWNGVENGDVLSTNSLVEVNADQAGTVIIGIATLEPIVGTGSLLDSSFVVLGAEGANATIGLQNVAAWDENGFDVLIETEDTNLAIIGTGGFPVWIIIIVAAVVLLGVAGWIARRSRAKPAVTAQAVAAPAGLAPSSVGATVSVGQPVTLLDGQQNPVGVLQPGRAYTIQDENAGWFAITDDAGNTGWGSRCVLEPLNPAQPWTWTRWMVRRESA